MQAADGDGRPSEPPPALGPLPPGRHQLTPEQVAYHQRERLIAGLAATVAERGYSAATVARITSTAHVSRRVFYEHFTSKEECFLAAFDAVVDHLRDIMRNAIEPYAGDWPRQLLVATQAVVDFFVAEPDLARLCMVESLSAGPVLRGRVPEVLEEFAGFMAGAGVGGDGPAPSKTTAVAILGTVVNRMTRQIASDGTAALPARLPGLVEFMLTPYLGLERARELAGEVATPTPAGNSQAEEVDG